MCGAAPIPVSYTHLDVYKRQVCDPEAEYFPLVQKLGGQVIRISPVSTDSVSYTHLDVYKRQLQTLVIALGAGLAVWGVVNLMEGYGNDNPGAKSQGIKQLMACLLYTSRCV